MAWPDGGFSPVPLERRVVRQFYGVVMVMTCGYRNYSDEHYTADRVAKSIVKHFSPRGQCLEPFKGEGAFYRHMPPGTDWCEMREGRDFFDWLVPVDWIVTNPPFSNMTKVFEHAFTLADNCVFVIPISKYWSSAPRIESVVRYGGLVEIAHLGRGRDIGFDIGFPFAAMHFKRGYRGHIRQTVLTHNVQIKGKAAFGLSLLNDGLGDF